MSESLFDTVLQEFNQEISTCTQLVAPVYLRGINTLVQKVQTIVSEITREDEKGVWIIFIRDVTKSLDLFCSPLKAPMVGINKIHEACLKLDSKYQTDFINNFIVYNI